MTRSNRGIALISTFIFLAVLLMMVVSMILTSRHRIFVGLQQYHQAQALYLAEAGLAKAQVALETDLSWKGTKPEGDTIEGLEGSYTVKFEPGKYGSVNNIGSAATADSYHNSDSVPRNTALLIVEANVSGQRYVLEALVAGQGSVGYVTDAILASGKIEAKGDFQIDGISALDDASKVEGSIQSNSVELIKWKKDLDKDGNPVGEAHLTGNVGTKGTSLDMLGAVIEGGPDYNSIADIPNYDIDAEVNGNQAHSTPSFVSGGTSILGSGNYSVTSDQVVQGDVVLKNGATLYVKGDLTVNGSISGEGKIYVTGNTTFKGDSSVTTNPDYTVSLYSKGNVKLTGFDGSEFLQSHTETRDLTNEAAYALRHAQAGMKAADYDIKGSQDAIWDASIALGVHKGHTVPLPPSHPDYNEWADSRGIRLPDGQFHKEVLVRLGAELNALPGGETRDFLSKRIDYLEKLFSSAADVYPTESNPEAKARNSFDDLGVTGGYLDSTLSAAVDDERWAQTINLINSVNYDKLGTSNFQGAIYTKGHFYADNEVNILGALIVDGTGGSPETISLPKGGTVTLNSGDIYLGNKTRVTYVEEMFKDGDEDITGPQKLVSKLWMGR